ncbi:MAG: 4-hydroxy-tetrahydrodipicolinate synthase [Gammaproteobacteria bacterium]|jgi:4-hydroxy-tetrahydrodipicolinate synthase|nr:4-hydroxy-tetrahydrodipicolinate synthase [Chromatiales bacterium]MDP6674049.1 4-hydroxy-tetrahydrodipicolinate synthase [Gammaproteobacteria bacterium]
MFKGSFVALVTPMSADGRIDYECLERLIDWQVEQGSNGLVIAGTTGESATLSKSEHGDLIRRSADIAAGRIPVIAGTGSNSTQQTIDLSLEVGDAGIDGYLMVTPYYNKPTQEGLAQHFRVIADAVEKPIMLYNVPGRTAVDLLPITVEQLAGHPRIMGIKEATGDVSRVAQIRAACGDDFGLYSGDDATAREFMLLGGDGVVTVAGNPAPAQMAAMTAAAIAGDAEEAARIDEGLAALHRDLFVESNPIPVKWALEKLGRIPAGIRLPLTRLSADQQPVVEAALNAAGLL